MDRKKDEFAVKNALPSLVGISIERARYKPSVGFFCQIEVIGFDVVSFLPRIVSDWLRCV
jgi:hypothetical protein